MFCYIRTSSQEDAGGTSRWLAVPDEKRMSFKMWSGGYEVRGHSDLQELLRPCNQLTIISFSRHFDRQGNVAENLKELSSTLLIWSTYYILPCQSRKNNYDYFKPLPIWGQFQLWIYNYWVHSESFKASKILSTLESDADLSNIKVFSTSDADVCGPEFYTSHTSATANATEVSYSLLTSQTIVA